MKTKRIYTLLAGLLFIFAGCAGTKSARTVTLPDAGQTSAPVAASDNATDNATDEADSQGADNATGEQVAQLEKLSAAAAAKTAEEEKATAAALPAEESTGEMIALNFDNADIYEVINALSDFLGINFIIDAGVKGRVNIHTAGEVDKSRLLPILETIFEMNNIALVEYGDFYKIVPIKEAQQQILDFSIGRELAHVPSYDQMMIQIVPLNYVEAKDVEKVLKQFKSRGGDIIDYGKGNLLIIVERAAAIRKMLRLINVIDVDMFAHNQVRFFKIKNADVKDIAKELQAIFSSVGIDKAPEKGLGLKIIPIERVSCVLAVSSIPDVFDKVEQWIKALDTVDLEAEEQVFIYFVENGKAEEISEVLNKVYGDSKSRKDTRRRTVTRTRRVKGKPAPKAESSVHLEGDIKIVVDEATNSIIVRATPHDYEIIKHTMVRLDMIPKQVLIEVLIAEVTLSGDTRFGIEWALLGDSATLGGYTGQDKAGIDFGIGGLGTDLASNLGQGFTYRFNSNRLETFLVAQASKNKLNILSSPHVLATDNKEARIEVGQEVPIVTSEYVPQDREVSTSTSRSIEYRSTGVILSVTPRINERGLVSMEVVQEVSEAQPIVAGGIQSPVISNRKAETSLVVQDGQTIVIGGLIKDQKNKTISGVPFLSSIPLLGYLFSDTNSKQEKTELIILITPHVISNLEESELVTREFNDKLKNVKKLIKRGGSYWDDYKEMDDK